MGLVGGRRGGTRGIKVVGGAEGVVWEGRVGESAVVFLRGLVGVL